MGPHSILAHYRITSKLCEGGMGTVYRATDTKLNREVALKVLPEGFARDPDRMSRFEREAKLLAALNHPNIAAIYGVEQNALVMELIEGEDLKGPLPVGTALNYARQIAAALDAAHEKGIIHRDLKPANIRITTDGVVKLLDFGLGKATEELSAVSGSPTTSPTLSITMTKTGMILGTAAYMSPEQARGKQVDKRADIWAFGVVLYEMLTGRRPFGGDDLTDTIAAVMKVEPHWNDLPLDTPSHIRRLMELCLRKDPKLRLRDIGDARLAMEETELVPLTTPRKRAWLPLAIVALVVASATVTTMTWFRATAVNVVAARFEVSLPEGTVELSAPALPQAVPSPDGHQLAFIAQDATTGKNYVWIRPLGSLSAQRLDSSERANLPFWSPDGKCMGYFTDQKLKKLAVSGASAQTICDTGAGLMDGGTWNQSGTIVFPTAEGRGPLMRVPATGGPATPVTELDRDRGEVSHSWPQFLPDGKHFIYLARSTDPDKSGIYVQELGVARRHMVLKESTRAAFAPPGYLLFAREGTLYAQSLDPQNFQLHGDAIPVAEEVSMNARNGRSAFAVSASGVLVFRHEAVKIRQLTWYDRRGKRLNVVGKSGEYSIMRVSPDERMVALQRRSGPGGDEDTWIMDVGSGITTRMTSKLKQTYPGPVWSPDSQRIVVSLETGGLKEIEVASGTMRTLSSDTNSIAANDWSQDGRFLVSASLTPTKVLLLPMTPEAPGSQRKMQTVHDSPDQKFGIRFSPDGQWVAYTSNATGDYELYLAPFPSFAEKRRVSQSGGLYPVWRKDGKELFFSTVDGLVMAADVKTGSKLNVGIPKPLFKINVSGLGQFAVAGDGQRFLVNELLSQSVGSQLTVVLNWPAGLKQ